MQRALPNLVEQLESGLEGGEEAEDEHDFDDDGDDERLLMFRRETRRAAAASEAAVSFLQAQSVAMSSTLNSATSKKRPHASSWDCEFEESDEDDEHMTAVPSGELSSLVRRLHVKEPRNSHMPYIS